MNQSTSQTNGSSFSNMAYNALNQSHLRAPINNQTSHQSDGRNIQENATIATNNFAQLTYKQDKEIYNNYATDTNSSLACGHHRKSGEDNYNFHRQSQSNNIVQYQDNQPPINQYNSFQPSTTYFEDQPAGHQNANYSELPQTVETMNDHYQLTGTQSMFQANDECCCANARQARWQDTSCPVYDNYQYGIETQTLAVDNVIDQTYNSGNLQTAIQSNYYNQHNDLDSYSPQINSMSPLRGSNQSRGMTRNNAMIQRQSNYSDMQEPSYQNSVMYNNQITYNHSLGPNQCQSGSDPMMEQTIPQQVQHQQHNLNVQGSSRCDNVSQVSSSQYLVDDSNIDTRSDQNSHKSQEYSHSALTTNDNISAGWLDTICRHLIEHMDHFGICVIDNFLGSAKGDLILEEVQRLYGSGQYSDGRLVSHRLNPKNSRDQTKSIRSDRVIWIDGYENGCIEINSLIQTFCSVITNSSRLSLYSDNQLNKVVINKRTKAHVACYPGNATRYVKHVDNPNGDGRVITAIYYLNKNWSTKRDGGLLRMFPTGITEMANIEPLFDRALFFWSDRRNPHEVLPAYRDRFAITVWFIGETRIESCGRDWD